MAKDTPTAPSLLTSKKSNQQVHVFCFLLIKKIYWHYKKKADSFFDQWYGKANLSFFLASKRDVQIAECECNYELAECENLKKNLI